MIAKIHLSKMVTLSFTPLTKRSTLPPSYESVLKPNGRTTAHSDTSGGCRQLFWSDEADQEATLTALRALRKDVLEPMVEDHSGTVLKRMGDGWLVEFSAISDAVRCALDVQTKVKSDSALQLRVGVHLGDVTFDADDIFGDGINLAARLQEGSDAGTVLISDVVQRSLDDRLSDLFRRAGERAFKNILRPIPVFQWVPPEAAP